MGEILAEKYHAEKATVFNGHKDWVYTRARPVDLETDYETVLDLAQVMNLFVYRHDWVAISSNNIFWEGSDQPLAVIQVRYPRGDDYLTLVNPHVELEGDVFLGLEGCGSIPGLEFRVPRFSHLTLEATMITEHGWQDMILKYGITDAGINGDFNHADDEMLDNAFYLQHEVDHLEGIILPQRNSLFFRFYNDLKEYTSFSKWVNMVVNKAIRDDDLFFRTVRGETLDLYNGRVIVGLTGLELVLGENGDRWVLHDTFCNENGHIQQMRLSFPKEENILNYILRVAKDDPLNIPEIALRRGIDECSCVKNLEGLEIYSTVNSDESSTSYNLSIAPASSQPCA